jgi:hypothetical protein
MEDKKGWTVLPVIILLIIAGFVFFGLPYGKFDNTTALAGYDEVKPEFPFPPTCLQLRGTNGKQVIIGTRVQLFEAPAGQPVMVNGNAIFLVPNTTFFWHSAKILKGVSWTEICASGGDKTAWIATAGIKGYR